jgi:hypothetical protein
MSTKLNGRERIYKNMFAPQMATHETTKANKKPIKELVNLLIIIYKVPEPYKNIQEPHLQLLNIYCFELLVSTWTAWLTLAAWTALTLLVTLGLLKENLARELELTGLWINLQKLNLELVTLVDAGLFHCLETLPVNLRDVQQTILAWHKLNECAIRHHAAYSTLVNLTGLGDSNDCADLCNSIVD